MDISHSLENGIDQRIQKRNGLRQLVRKGVFVTQEMSEYLAQLLSSQTSEGFFVSQILVMAVKLDLRQSGFNMKFFEKTDKQFVSTFLVKVLLVDEFGQNAVMKMYTTSTTDKDNLTLFLGLLVATNTLLEILFSEILQE